jgi:carbamoyltransferase
VNVLGITLGHDSSCALVADGEVLAILEAERYFRQKRYKLHCLDTVPGKRANGYQYVDVADLQFFISMIGREWGTAFDALAVQNQGRVDEFENLQSLLRQAGFTFGTVHQVDHHLSHAALAFYTSPYDEALILSYDGFGNDGRTIVFKAGPQGIRYLERNGIRFGQCYNNLGYIAGVTPDVSGVSSGKTMGLTAYGTIREDWLPYARKYVRQYRKAPPRLVDGLNDYGRAHRINSIGLEEIPDLQQFVSAVEPVALPAGWRPWRRTEERQSVELRLPGPDAGPTQDLVRTVQEAWTEQVVQLLAAHRSVSVNLCVVGGCALNGITNFAIQQHGMFGTTHFVPNPSDCGLSAGAALYVSFTAGGLRFAGYGDYFSPYLGAEPFDRADLPALREEYPHRDLRSDEAARVLAWLVHSGRIVGVMRGRYEVGPRALGHRSILCSPYASDMREALNQKVKHREWFRPFAPVVTAEDARTYFTNQQAIPYMSVICYTRREYAERLPAVTHVDGSARLQTIERTHNPFLHRTLKEFERLSGMPIMLNTSFNPRGEPILNFCAVGLEMLKTTDLDLVLLDDTLFCRPGREALLEFALADAP